MSAGAVPNRLQPGLAEPISGLASLNAAQVAAVLGMLPHREGGYYRETYRSSIVTPTPVGLRSLCTSILYLLTETDPSRFHRLRFDEVWFFHGGSPVEMVFLDPVQTLALGPDAPQALAAGGRWVAARILGAERSDAAPPLDCEPECEGEQTDGASAGDPRWALVGCVVNPGFEYDDFEAGERGALLATYPEAADHIRQLA